MSDWTSLVNGLNAGVLAAFGREVLYLSNDGGLYTIQGVLEATQQQEEKHPGAFAILFIRLSDLAVTPDRGDEVQMDSITYKVFEVETDGQGGARLGLHRQ
jgi:hypothetical protein